MRMSWRCTRKGNKQKKRRNVLHLWYFNFEDVDAYLRRNRWDRKRREDVICFSSPPLHYDGTLPLDLIGVRSLLFISIFFSFFLSRLCCLPMRCISSSFQVSPPLLWQPFRWGGRVGVAGWKVGDAPRKRWKGGELLVPPFLFIFCF